ncbi:MAG: replication-relaxation family protein, partial [Sciscionella sp.]
DRALDIAHSLRLTHTVGVNDWFTTLITHTHQHPDHTLSAWWSETRCARHFGDLARPDGYGRWATGGHHIEFFLEYDTGTEPLTQLAAKLLDYAALAAATAITTPVLIWLPTTRRETTARHQLTTTWRTLDHPSTVPVATAAADQLTSPHTSPADPLWLPLEPTPGGAGRRGLHRLHHAWPQLPTLTPPPVMAPARPPLPAPTPQLPPP